MNIDIKDGRGQNKIEDFERNKKTIIKFFEQHPGSTAIKCCYFTGLSYKTVLTHLKKIRE